MYIEYYSRDIGSRKRFELLKSIHYETERSANIKITHIKRVDASRK